MTAPDLPDGRLDERVAVITGASRGIGAAAAHHLAGLGARVIVVAEPRPERIYEAEAVVADISRAGGTAVATTADLNSPEQIDAMVEQAAAHWGRLDIIIANAAATGRARWQEIEIADWDRIQSVNVRGTYLLARAAHPWLCRSPSASIIAVTSVMVETGQPGALAYTASKAALIGLVRALAREVGPDGIRVNLVMPGAIRTEEEIESFPDGDAVAADLLPLQALKRRGSAADLAGAFGYLAADTSSFVTGQIITVDGGWVMR